MVILFTYYQDDAVTRTHHALLCHHHPTARVVPLYDRQGVGPGFVPFLPDSVDVGAAAWRWGPRRDPLYNVDTFLYRWWREGRACDVNPSHVAVIESDCLVTRPLWEHFAHVWACDVAGSVIATPASHPDWEWWGEAQDIPTWARAGVMPSGVVLYSRRAVECLSETRLECFAELRIGSAARLAGLKLAEVPGQVDTVHCHESLIRLSDRPGVYHPVKQWGGRDGLCLAAHESGVQHAAS
jgi:hypothetical protein